GAALLLLALGAAGHARTMAPPPAPPGAFPIAFAEADESRFIARGPSGTLFVRPDGAALLLPADPSGGSRALLTTHFRGSNPAARGAGLERLPGRASSFVGRDRSKWRAGIPTFAAVRYDEVYPGISVTWHGRGGRLEYDFVVAPGADPSCIRLRFEGADRVVLAGSGELVLSAGVSDVRHLRPVAYQEQGGAREPVEADWLLADGDQGTFALGRYDRTRPLVIDPVIVGAAVLGGTGFDSANAVALDAAGNVYVTGETGSPDFPLAGSATRVPAGENDVFVAKLDPTATTLLYSTVVGGRAAESGTGIAVDSAGNAWVTGETVSTDFPTAAGAFQPALAGATDAFVVKLDPSGAALLVSTFLGGEGFDRGNGIAADGAGGAAIAGRTGSLAFPTTKDALQTFFRGSDFDAFFSRFDAAGALVHSTYLGGSENDAAFGVALDAANRAYVVGGTRSPDFPATPSAFQGSNLSTDAFVSAFAPGGALLYSTFLGGSFVDRGNAIAVDPRGRVIVAGWASSPDFPAVSATQGTYGGGPNDAFVAMIDPSAAGDASLLFSTFLGGPGDDRAHGVAALSDSAVWVAGQASAIGFPIIDPSFAAAGGDASDAFAARFDLAASPLLRFST
ncbi:MAG: SBBP repeat-containing protein, partial [Acidobacteriota bacterium]